MQVHVPSRTEHTSVRPGCDGRLDTPPTSTWGCCTWQALVGPPIYRPKRSLGEERFSGSREWGMIISSSSTSSSFSPEDSNSEEVSPSPPPPHAFAIARTTPLSRSFYFCTGHLSFSAWLASYLAISSGKVIPRMLLCTHPRPYNMSVVGKKGRN
jgi:hypothetical protein